MGIDKIWIYAMVWLLCMVSAVTFVNDALAPYFVLQIATKLILLVVGIYALARIVQKGEIVKE